MGSPSPTLFLPYGTFVELEKSTPFGLDKGSCAGFQASPVGQGSCEVPVHTHILSLHALFSCSDSQSSQTSSKPEGSSVLCIKNQSCTFESQCGQEPRSGALSSHPCLAVDHETRGKLLNLAVPHSPHLYAEELRVPTRQGGYEDKMKSDVSSA